MVTFSSVDISARSFAALSGGVNVRSVHGQACAAPAADEADASARTVAEYIIFITEGKLPINGHLKFRIGYRY